MEHSSAPNGELGARRAKAQSYFDRYPERKGQGPYVPSATLVPPVKGESSRRPSDSLIKQWHSRGDGESNSRAIDGGRSPRRTTVAPVCEKQASVLEAYRAKTAAAAAARTPGISEAEQPNGAKQKEKEVLSIDEIIRKHSPLRKTHDCNDALPSIVRPEEGDDANDSDASSINSVELEVRQTLNVHTPQRRQTRATQSPALQAAFYGPPDGEGYVRPERMTPSLSAPALLHKKSTPTLLFASRKSAPSPSDSTTSFSPTPPSRTVSRSKSNTNLGSFPASKASMRASSSSHPVPPLPSSSVVPPREEGLMSEELSVKLTRLIALRRPPYAGKTVSLADVGDPDGRVVFLFLGLGAVRYLAGLYDDMAAALGLRIICIDRWGMGKTDDLPADRRGVLEWSSVVAEVADRLSIPRFSLLAHSAGAPYAMATCLILRHRIAGPVHLLAPWVSPTIESGYKWLRYVPDGFIRTAQAAEWRMQAWKLGVSGKSVGDTSESAIAEGHTSSDSALSSYADSSQTSFPSSPLPFPEADGVQKHGRKASMRASLSSVAEANFVLLDAWQSRATSDGSVTGLPPPLPPKTPMKDRMPSLDISPSARSTLRTPSPLPVPSPTSSSSTNVDLPTELLRASHAESGGSANDLLVILGRSSQKPWGFSYVDVRHPVRVWHGEKDERVSLSSVLWMERELEDCRVQLIKGANHGLMTNVKVVVEALEHVASHAF